MLYSTLDEIISFKSFSHDKERFYFKILKWFGPRNSSFKFVWSAIFFLKVFWVRNTKSLGNTAVDNNNNNNTSFI